MFIKTVLYGLLFWWIPMCFAASGPEVPKQTVGRTIASGDVAVWSIALLIVLSVFFLCVWAMRKLSGSTAGGAEKMRVVGGVSLGMREKVVLLQVGKKQLILAVTPGRIETLHVLEDEDCLIKDEATPVTADAGFAQKLLQVLKGAS